MSGFTRVKWALRKSRLPVKADGLVLDIGSGGTPYPRADVLFDRLTGAEHRCGDSMMIDRPAVLGDARKIPFRDKSFDFIVASHILEHMAEPEVFLEEIQRIGKAGVIETPNAIFERLHPHHIHCLEVMSVNGVLHIHKKTKPYEDSFFHSIGFLEHDEEWKKMFSERLDLFHVRLFWIGEIKYKVHNPEISCDWIETINEKSSTGGIKNNYSKNSFGWRKVGLNFINKWAAIKRKEKLKNFELRNILCCPDCRGELFFRKKFLICRKCDVAFNYDPFPDFTKKSSVSQIITSQIAR